jgi:hypothetical protein
MATLLCSMTGTLGSAETAAIINTLQIRCVTMQAGVAFASTTSPVAVRVSGCTAVNLSLLH